MLFFTSDTDRKHHSADHLVDSYSSVLGSQCFLVGAGPGLFESYTKDGVDAIARSSIPKISMNYGGFSDFEGWRVWPDIWTTYDPTNRFSAEVIWSPRTLKFFLGSRAMNLIPGSTHKLCDAPRTVFFDSQTAPYSEYFGTGPILDSKDSFLQSLDIAIRLGFRHIYCVGVDLRIKPSEALLDLLTKEAVPHGGLNGVLLKNGTYSDRLNDYIMALAAMRKLSVSETIEDLDKELGRFGSTHRQYCCEESKSLAAAIVCDNHYWHSVQYLRLARRSLARCGAVLYSEKGSRLAPYFPIVDPATTALGHGVVIPADSTIGKYTEGMPASKLLYHTDIPPYVEAPKPTKAQASRPRINEEA